MIKNANLKLKPSQSGGPHDTFHMHPLSKQPERDLFRGPFRGPNPVFIPENTKIRYQKHFPAQRQSKKCIGMVEIVLIL